MLYPDLNAQFSLAPSIEHTAGQYPIERYQSPNHGNQATMTQSVPTNMNQEYIETSASVPSNDFTGQLQQSRIQRPSSVKFSKKTASKMKLSRGFNPRTRQSLHKGARPSPAIMQGKKGTADALNSPSSSTSKHLSKTESSTSPIVMFREAISAFQKLTKPFSPLSQRKAAHLVSKVEELVDKLDELALDEKMYGGGTSSDIDDSTQSSTTASSYDSLSSSELVDSESVTDNTSVSLTSCQSDHETQETVSQATEQPEVGHTPCGQCGLRPLYYCTRDECSYSSHSSAEWRRHEESQKHSQQQRFMCLECASATPSAASNGYPQCEFCSVLSPTNVTARIAHYLQCERARQDAATYGRKDRLITHLRNIHHITLDVSQKASDGQYDINSEWPRQCGFCVKQFETWDERMEHLAEHFQKGKKMSSWKQPFPTPKDSGPGFKPYRKDDDDSDDGMNGNGGGSRNRQVANMSQKASTSSISSQKSKPSGTQTNGSQYQRQKRGQVSQSVPKEYRKASVAPEKEEESFGSDAQRYQKPSVALERYLNDGEDPGLKYTPVTGRISRAEQGAPAHACDICKPVKVRCSVYSKLLLLTF